MSESFRAAVLVQEVMVITILNGIDCRICIAALLDELPHVLGGIRVGIHDVGAVHFLVYAQLVLLFRREDFFVGFGLVPA